MKTQRPSNSLKTLSKIFIGASLLCAATIGGLIMWQYKLTNLTKLSGLPKEQQADQASSANFETIKPSDERLEGALQATDISKAHALLNQRGEFVGTVANVRSSAGHKKVVLDFAAQRETALRAVVKTRNFSKFPNLEKLVGQKVLVYGTFAPHEGRAEIEVSELGQLKIIS